MCKGQTYLKIVSINLYLTILNIPDFIFHRRGAQDAKCVVLLERQGRKRKRRFFFICPIRTPPRFHISPDFLTHLKSLIRSCLGVYIPAQLKYRGVYTH